MKNKFEFFGIIAIIAVMGLGFAACSDGSNDGGGIDFNVTNKTAAAITNIKVYDYDLSLGTWGERVGEAKYNSGAINTVTNATHSFKVLGLTDRGGYACFQIEVTSSEGTQNLVTTNGYWYSANFTFEGDSYSGLHIN